MLRDIFCACVCVLKKDDVFIDWSSWLVVGPIVLPKLWFECGLSSNQIRTNDVRNVVLLVVVSSSIHHYIFWVWPMLSPCSHDGGSPVIWKFRWVAVEPISSILSSPMNHVEHQPSVGNLCKHFFVFRSWSICSDERSDFLLYMCIWWKLPPWIWES